MIQATQGPGGGASGAQEGLKFWPLTGLLHGHVDSSDVHRYVQRVFSTGPIGMQGSLHGGEPTHLHGGELEVEYVCVFLKPMPLRTPRNELESHLEPPSQKHLRWGFARMGGDNFSNSCVLQESGASFEHGAVRHDYDSVVQAILQEVFSFIVNQRVHLELVYGRHLHSVVGDRLQMLNVPVRHADGFDETPLPQLQHGAPCFHEPPPVGGVDEVQVDVVDAG